MHKGISIRAPIERRIPSINRAVLEGYGGTDVRRLLAAVISALSRLEKVGFKRTNPHHRRLRLNRLARTL